MGLQTKPTTTPTMRSSTAGHTITSARLASQTASRQPTVAQARRATLRALSSLAPRSWASVWGMRAPFRPSA